MKIVNFGLHLTIDMYNCDESKLDSISSCYKFLDSLPKEINMHPLMPPYVISVLGNDIKDPGGYSGFIMIEESHISIHTFPRRKFLTADIYSCNEFDTEFVINYFKRYFKTDDIEVNIIKRGTRYPKENLST